MRRTFVIALALASVPCISYGQQSLFQTSDGQSSLYLQESTAALNLGDSKASLGFTHHDNKDNSWIWGYEVLATANKGVASLFTSGKAKAPEGGGDFTVGKHFLATSNALQHVDPDMREYSQAHPGEIVPFKTITNTEEDWALLDIGYSYSTFLVSSIAVNASANKTSFHRYRAIAAYNYFYGGSFIGGFATGIEHRNNTGDLKSAQFQTVLAPAPGGTTGSVVTTQTGFYGTYKEYVAVPVDVDLLFYPGKLKTPGFGNRVGFDLISRADVAAPYRGALGGLGIFFFKKGNATVPIGGVTGTYDGSKFQVSLTTGITVGK